MRFHTLLPKTGPWRVYAWSNGRTGFGNTVQVEVKAADGAVSPAEWGQSLNAGRWMLLGTFWFNDTEEAEVKILHSDAGMLSADAVRF